MKVISTKITGKSNGYYHVSFQIEKQSVNHPVLADNYVHEIKIVSSGISFTRREEQALAGFARIAKEKWEKENKKP